MIALFVMFIIKTAKAILKNAVLFIRWLIEKSIESFVLLVRKAIEGLMLLIEVLIDITVWVVAGIVNFFRSKKDGGSP